MSITTRLNAALAAFDYTAQRLPNLNDDNDAVEIWDADGQACDFGVTIRTDGSYGVESWEAGMVSLYSGPSAADAVDVIVRLVALAVEKKAERPRLPAVDNPSDAAIDALRDQILGYISTSTYDPQFKSALDHLKRARQCQTPDARLRNIACAAVAFDLGIEGQRTIAAIRARRLAEESSRPGDQAAVYAAETGVDYSAALVACNMD